jgi:lipopolysaccharide transport system ATP-binding protein
MSDIAIKVQNLSKAYQLGEFTTGTLSRDIERWWYKLRGKEDPFLRIGETNDRSTKGGSDIVWSLNDISFAINRGDAVGIIGRNGAGKSTLLKILSRVTSPTLGDIKVKGRIASLLEVGTGFHPELTGRENIFLNGAILGMRNAEIKRQFDAIVDFAGVERYIDTPVKRYSSGMYVRLAFAVAAYLESEILIVDEVLAVGDAEFQKKCLGKMGEISKGEGRTVLFVSHNIGMISQLCNKGLLLKNGQLHNFNDTDLVVNDYLSDNDFKGNYFEFELNNRRQVGQFTKFEITNDAGQSVQNIPFDSAITVRFEYIIHQYIPGVMVSIGLQDKYLNRITTFFREIENAVDRPISGSVTLPAGIIAPKNYSFTIALWKRSGEIYDIHESIGFISIKDNGTEYSLFEGSDYGSIILNVNWDKAL